MTSDAKVGLLLGLFFIFVIAFIINGLPRFHNDTNSNVLTTMANSPNDSVIGSNARKVQAALGQQRQVSTRKPSTDETQPAEKEEVKVRYKRPLPQEDAAVKDEQAKNTTNDKVTPPAPAPEVKNETKVDMPNPVKPDLPKIYVVQDGDCLAKIAQKFYGPERGNKAINVNRIFEANRKVLKLPDEIQIGQKLVIPLLKDEEESVFSGSLFERIKSTIGITPSPDNKSEETPVRPRPKLPVAGQTKYYVVCEGDSLWRIADKQLGDKERYREIIKLNDLEDEDYLKLGQRLVIPAR